MRSHQIQAAACCLLVRKPGGKRLQFAFCIKDRSNAVLPNLCEVKCAKVESHLMAVFFVQPGVRKNPELRLQSMVNAAFPWLIPEQFFAFFSRLVAGGAKVL